LHPSISSRIQKFPLIIIDGSNFRDLDIIKRECYSFVTGNDLN